MKSTFSRAIHARLFHVTNYLFVECFISEYNKYWVFTTYIRSGCLEKTGVAFITAILVSYFITPWVMKLAKKVGAIDIPADNRRVHINPMPRLGGLAIFAGFLAAAFVTLDFATIRNFAGIIGGATIVVIVGFYDDIKPISAGKKLAFQIIAAAMVVYGGGIVIKGFTNPLFFLMPDAKIYISFGILAIPVTIFWIVGVTNAVNLIDGMDGLAAGISVISSVTLMIVAIITADGGSRSFVIALSAGLAGAAIGFLPYNFNPAKIFMGDTGSMLLGFMLAVISIMGAMKGAATFSIAVPLLAVGVPIFDTLLAMIRRVINRKPVMEADKGHLHHRLMDKGFSHKQTVLSIYLISIFLGLAAIATVLFKLTTGVLIIGLVLLFATIFTMQLGILRRDEE